MAAARDAFVFLECIFSGLSNRFRRLGAVPLIDRLSGAMGCFWHLRHVALLLAGTASGFIASKPLWAHYVGSIFGQFLYGLLFLSMGPLAVVGFLFLVLWSFIFLGGAYLGSRMRIRTMRR